MIINEKNTTDLSGFYIIYNGSVNLEKPGWYGISHLMEHLMCKNFNDLQNTLDENGITWNAYTSINRIVFYFTGLEEYLSKFRNILVDRLSKFDVDEEDFKKEKQIVLEEYLDCFVDSTSSFYHNYMRKKYDCYDAIGLKEDIENITYQDCLDFFEIQYKHPDMIINISKDFEYKNDDLIFSNRDDLLKSDWNKNDSTIFENNKPIDNKTCIIYDMFVEQNDIPVLNILNSILVNGLQSPLYKEIREKLALAYYIHCYISKIGNVSILRISTMTSPDKIDKIEESIKKIFSNKEKYITQERLDIIKKHHIISKRKNMINRYKNISDIIDNDTKKTYDIIDSISLDDIYHVFDKYYQLENFDRTTDKDL